MGAARERVSGANRGFLLMARILIIDDDAPTCELVGEFLRRQSHQVFSAGDGGQGLAAVVEHRPELVICDLDMPGMNGQGVVSTLRHDERFDGLPVVFLSGCTDRAEIRRTMNLGADDFLNKPVQLSELLEAVNARLGLQQKKQQNEERRLASAVDYFAGLINDLQPEEGQSDKILAEVRQRLYPAKGANAVQAQAAFLAKDANGRQLVKLSEVKLISAYGEYSQAHWGKDRHLLIRKPLKSWEQELPAHQFVRVHRQALVNLAFLERVERNEGKLVLRLRDHAEGIPVSQRSAALLNRRLKQYEQEL
jgi:DNA-binding LytR/AlgR family response regulator